MSTIKETLLQAAVEYGQANQEYKDANQNGCPAGMSAKLAHNVVHTLADLQEAATDYFNDTLDGAE